MNMKLSYRDKVIFIAVVVIMVLVAGFFIFVKSALNESQNVKNNLTLKEQERDDVDAKIATLPDLQTQLENSVKEVDTTQDVFYTEQEAYEADQMLYDILKDSGAYFKGMELTGEKAGTLSDYFYVKNSTVYDLKMNADLSGTSFGQEVYDAYSGNVPAGADDVILAVEEVTITFAIPCDESGLADWDPIYSIFDGVSLNDKTLYLKSFSAGEQSVEVVNDVNTVEVTAVVDVISVQHMDISQAK